MTDVPNRAVRTTTILPSAPLAEESLENALTEALRFHRNGQADDAERLYRTIIATPSPQASASYGLGLLCQVQGRLIEAAEAYRRAIDICSDNVDARVNLATTLLALGRNDEAIAQYEAAIKIKPDFALAYGNLGKALQDQGRLAEAIEAYGRAIALDPASAVAFANLGGALLDHGDSAAAVAASERAIALLPCMALAHANRAVGLFKVQRYEDAYAACRRAMDLGQVDGLLLATIGGVLLEIGAFQDSYACCRGAIALKPEIAMAHFNLAHAAKAMNLIAEAEAACRAAVMLAPERPDYHFLLAHLLLLQGDYERGWQEYEWRWRLPDFEWLRIADEEFTQPIWNGDDIAGRTILLLTEQGIGDILLFIRYAPLLVERGAYVVIAAPPAMQRLLSLIPRVTVVPLAQRPLPDFDVFAPLLSLPRLFATSLATVPAQVPYLRADPAARAKWNLRLLSRSDGATQTDTPRPKPWSQASGSAAPRPNGSVPRVGIVWAGNPATKYDRFRSPGLQRVAPLFDVPGIDFVALQVGPAREGAGGFKLPVHVLDLGDDIDDLATTAAIMSELDLVVSSCTGPLHLAGALGVPSWALLPFAPYFPWLLERTDSIWYPTMRLFRQARAGEDWTDVIDLVADELAAFARMHMASQMALQRVREPVLSGLVSGPA